MSSKDHGFFESLAISFGNWLLRKIGEYHRELCPFVFAALAFGCAYTVAPWLGYLAALAAFCLAAYWNWSPAALRKHGERRRLDRLVKALPSVFERLGLVCRIPDSQGDFLAPTVLGWERLPGSGARLNLRLPLGITLADVQNRSEALAGALGGSSAEVAAAPSRKAHEVVLTVVGVDDLLYGSPLRPEPLYALEAGRSPLEPSPLGYDSFGDPVFVSLFEKSLIVGGSPGSGKSVGMQSLVFAAAMSRDTELWLIDPKGGVELVSFWERCAERVAIEVDDATELLDSLIEVMEARYKQLREHGQQKVSIGSSTPLIVLVIDELAELTSNLDKNKANDFASRLRLLVAKGRAAGITPIVCTQKPSSDVVPTAIRDLFSTRHALRCGTAAQAQTILGEEAVKERGADASTIGTDTPGLGYLVGETGGDATRLRTYFLQPDDMTALSSRATVYRHAPLWEAAGFTPAEAEAWAVVGFYDEKAERRNVSFEPATARLWVGADFAPIDAARWSKAGFTLDEAKAWRAEGWPFVSTGDALPNKPLADSSHSRPLTTQGGQNENVSQITSKPSVITCSEHEHLSGNLDAAALSIFHDCPSCVYLEGAN